MDSLHVSGALDRGDPNYSSAEVARFARPPAVCVVQ